jgi:hypothetical protein
MTDTTGDRRRSLLYSLPQTLGFFFRELLAVSLILLLEQRVSSYDFFNTAFILLLVLITFRTPYVNSYAFLFEISSINKWSISQHAGLQKHADFTQNLFLFVAVFGAHIGAAIGAAALRVLMDVAYGNESMLMNGGTEPVLGVSVESLISIDTFWGTEKRIERLAASGLLNGTRSVVLPLGDISYLGLDSAAVALWYLLEEIGYVTLLCICYVHIWLGAGLAKDEMKPMEPFKSEFWKRLFRMSFLFAFVNTALHRCFPTAHGSLHHTIFKCQYQAWNPNMHLVDNDNQEPLIRVLGGLIGVVLAYSYNKMLVATRDTKDDEGFYYRLVWGREPVADEKDAAKAVPYPLDRSGGSKYSRYGGGGGGKYSRMAMVVATPPGQEGYDPAADCDMHTICVTQTRCKRHPDGHGCTAECKSGDGGGGSGGWGGNFKLRIPYTLDHPK